MKNVLIISPDWIPSNLVGIQRPRILCNHLEQFGWHPVILTVDPQYYRQEKFPELQKLVSSQVEVHYVSAFNHLPGCNASILRGFRQLYREGVRLCKTGKIDFIWMPVPPGAAIFLTRLIHNRTKVPYAIDYTDPWITPLEKRKHPVKQFIVQFMARILEPYCVRKAAFLAGVTELTVKPVFDRNPELRNIPSLIFPLGFDPDDFRIAAETAEEDKKSVSSGPAPLVYAGGFFLKSRYFSHLLFDIIRELDQEGIWPKEQEIHYIGTGNSPDGYSVRQCAEDHGIGHIVKEFPERISYLKVLQKLTASSGIWMIGGTEAHYTASKVFQSLLSKRPVFGVFHEASTVNGIMHDCKADRFLVRYSPEQPEEKFRENLKKVLTDYLQHRGEWNADLSSLEPYSSVQLARRLCAQMDQAVGKGSISS